MSDTTEATPQRAGKREWMGLAVLALPTLLIALDIGVLFLALPHLSADLGATGTESLWITDTYGFLLAGFLITMGTLGDRVGRRKLLLIGAAAFGAASLLAAYSTSPEMLIVARGLLGVAGATLGPSTLALISNMFHDARQRTVAISIWGTCQFGGAALGPVIGGVLLQHFWWGSVFLLGAPVMVLLLVVGPILLPEYRNPNAGRWDIPSVLLSLIAILPVVYGIKELAAGTTSAAVNFAAIAFGLAMAVLFLRRQRKLDEPLIDLKLFQRPGFALTLGAMSLGSAAFAGTSLLTSQYIQSVVGLSPGAAGLWQAPTGIGIAAGVLLAPVVIKYVHPTKAITGGMIVSSVSLLALTLVGSTGGLYIVALCIALVAFGVGPLFALGTGMVVSSAPMEKAGSAASLSESSNVFGSTIGLAILGTVGTAVYRNLLGDGMPAGTPEAAAAASRETIGAAVASADALPAAQGDALVTVARDAFTSSLNIVAAVSSALMLLLAVAFYRKMRPSAAPQSPEQDAPGQDTPGQDATAASAEDESASHPTATPVAGN